MPLMPILVPGPRPSPTPTRRELARQQRTAAHAAGGHRERASTLRAAADATKDALERAGLETMAKTHDGNAAEFEAEASRCELAIKSAAR